MKSISSKKGYSEEHLIEGIYKGDKDAFKRLFFEYYYDLYTFASGMIRSEAQAKDVVQEVFLNLWKRREEWEIKTSLSAYLFQSVRNRALNLMKKQQRRHALQEELSRENPHRDEQSLSGDYEQQLVDQIWEHVKSLPRRRRSVFILHRRHGLTYKEIAEVLNVTRKTVENHMGMALDDLRQKMKGTPIGDF
jgi:RNA polymerase sigma-70 factor (ECF subfamily)